MELPLIVSFIFHLFLSQHKNIFELLIDLENYGLMFSLERCGVYNSNMDKKTIVDVYFEGK